MFDSVGRSCAPPVSRFGARPGVSRWGASSDRSHLFGAAGRAAYY